MPSSPIRLADLPSYKRAIVATGDCAFATARDAYLECISACRDANDLPNLGFLLQRLGDVEAEAGNRHAAEERHLEAISLDPRSPLPRIFFARSFLQLIHDAEAARVELNRAEALLAAGNFPCDAEELPFAYYEREIAALRAKMPPSAKIQ
jgi:predicted Zn-dependent protease